MRRFKVFISPLAFNDIQKAIDYYNDKQKGLGKRFHVAVKSAVGALRINPFYQLRYDNVRCFSVKRFPYMLHFTVHEEVKTVIIHAVIHTSLDLETPGKSSGTTS